MFRDFKMKVSALLLWNQMRFTGTKHCQVVNTTRRLIMHIIWWDAYCRFTNITTGTNTHTHIHTDYPVAEDIVEGHDSRTICYSCRLRIKPPPHHYSFTSYLRRVSRTNAEDLLRHLAFDEGMTKEKIRLMKAKVEEKKDQNVPH